MAEKPGRQTWLFFSPTSTLLFVKVIYEPNHEKKNNNNNNMANLLSVAPVFGHHLSQRLQDFDAQSLLVLLQQLFGVFDQPTQEKKPNTLLKPNSKY